jgi:hypothetical protein
MLALAEPLPEPLEPLEPQAASATAAAATTHAAAPRRQTGVDLNIWNLRIS